MGGSSVWGNLGQERATGTSTWPGPRLLLWQQDWDREAQAAFPVLLQNWPKAGQSQTEWDRVRQRGTELDREEQNWTEQDRPRFRGPAVSSSLSSGPRGGPARVPVRPTVAEWLWSGLPGLQKGSEQRVSGRMGVETSRRCGQR